MSTTETQTLAPNECFTGQLFNGRDEYIDCPHCGKEIGLRSTAWFDIHTGLPSKSNGLYVCYGCLSAKRKEELSKETN